MRFLSKLIIFLLISLGIVAENENSSHFIIEPGYTAFVAFYCSRQAILEHSTLHLFGYKNNTNILYYITEGIILRIYPFPRK